MWHPGRVANSPEKGPPEPVERDVLVICGAGGAAAPANSRLRSPSGGKNKIPSSIAIAAVVTVPGSARVAKRLVIDNYSSLDP